MMMSTAASAPKIPSPSFLAIFLRLFRRPVFQDDFVAYPVSHDSGLVVVLQRQVNDLLDLLPRAHDAHGDHALTNRDAFMRPNPFAGHKDRQTPADLLNLAIPHSVETRM